VEAVDDIIGDVSLVILQCSMVAEHKSLQSSSFGPTRQVHGAKDTGWIATL
jgi:hypothetical protein